MCLLKEFDRTQPEYIISFSILYDFILCRIFWHFCTIIFLQLIILLHCKMQLRLQAVAVFVLFKYLSLYSQTHTLHPAPTAYSVHTGWLKNGTVFLVHLNFIK